MRPAQARSALALGVFVLATVAATLATARWYLDGVEGDVEWRARRVCRGAPIEALAPGIATATREAALLRARAPATPRTPRPSDG